MSLGEMKTLIEIIRCNTEKDAEGFAKQTVQLLATVRAYREGRHGSEKWANRAVFSEATELFRLRRIPDLEITTELILVCDQGRYEITSVENVRGRSMYWEVLAKKVVPSIS